MTKRTTKDATAPAAGTPMSKIATAEALLRRSEGATLDQLVEATGWQAHSVRGAMSGNLKKKRGLSITSAKVDGTRTYRIASKAVA